MNLLMSMPFLVADAVNLSRLSSRPPSPDQPLRLGLAAEIDYSQDRQARGAQ